MRENLERVSRIVPFVATCGTELEEWAKGYSDPLEGYFADAVMLQFLGQANRALREAVRREWFRESDMSCMSPGSLSAWPLPEQANLFELVGGVTEAIGVRLTPSYLMLPSKSTSGFFLFERDPLRKLPLLPHHKLSQPQGGILRGAQVGEWIVIDFK